MPLTHIMETMPQGTHMCSIYKNDDEKFAAIIPFLKGGQARGERCVYIVDESTSEEMFSLLNQRGYNLFKGINKWGQWQFLTKDESYLVGGSFDPERMIKLLRETERKTLEDEFEGLRVTGEMTWVLLKMPGSEKVIEYESKLNLFLPGSRTLAICQYNENKFDEDTLIKVVYTHPKIILYGNLYDNPFYIPPENFNEVLAGKKTDYRSAVDTLVKLDKLL